MGCFELLIIVFKIFWGKTSITNNFVVSNIKQSNDSFFFKIRVISVRVLKIYMYVSKVSDLFYVNSVKIQNQNCLILTKKTYMLGCSMVTHI